jgi:hypothetical protein
MTARIYQPAKTAMQSGEGNGEWVLVPDVSLAVSPDPLMGWSGSTETAKQVVLTFPTRDAAVAYAEREGLAYSVAEPLPRKHIRRSYADNFKFGRIGTWTH